MTECSSRHQVKKCEQTFTFALMTTGAFSRNVGKLFSELKFVTDNLPLHLCRSQLRSSPSHSMTYSVCPKVEKSAQLEAGLETMGSGSFVQSAMFPPVSMGTTRERSSSVETSVRHGASVRWNVMTSKSLRSASISTITDQFS